jgi:hypothetical protein
MVRPATRRRQKYEAKIDPDVLRSRILAFKSAMTEQMDEKASELATLETQVKSILEAQTTTIYSPFIPMYLNVGRELYRLSKKFGGKTFEGEAVAVLDKWKTRGLNKDVLSEIAGLFGVTYT